MTVHLCHTCTDRFPSEDIESLRRMVSRDPGLLCIADQYTDQIWRTCRETGFDLIVLEPYFGGVGGWALLAERMPSDLTKVISPTTYLLSRGDRLGDSSVVMMLPRSFPASYYKIRLPVESSSNEEENFVHVRRFQSGPGVVLPLALVPEHATVRAKIIDPSRGMVQLVVED